MSTIVAIMQELLVDYPLYKPMDVSELSPRYVLREIERFSGPINAYCVECQTERIFRNQAVEQKYAGVTPAVLPVVVPNINGSHNGLSVPLIAPKLDDKDFTIHLMCTNDSSHIMYLHVLFRGGS
jgi:hypothetical protein